MAIRLKEKCSLGDYKSTIRISNAVVRDGKLVIGVCYPDQELVWVSPEQLEADGGNEEIASTIATVLQKMGVEL